jgi:hypothetical protein
MLSKTTDFSFLLRFEVLAAVLLKVQAFWTLCSLEWHIVDDISDNHCTLIFRVKEYKKTC